jgi:PAS domain S-box-containing protein
MFAGAATGITVTDLEGRFVYSNPAFCRTVGYSEEELRGTDFQSITVPEDQAASQEARERMTSGGADTVVLEKRYRRKSGETVWVRVSLSLVRGLDGRASQFVAVTEDITEQKRAEGLLLGQNRVLEMIAVGAPLPEILGALLRIVEEQSDEMLASILLLDREGRRLRHVAAPRLPPALLAGIDGAEIGEGAGSCGTAAHRGEMVVVEDIATDPLWKDYRALALEHGLRACWSTPIFDARRDVLGTFALYFRVPSRPGPEHLRVIEIATRTAAVAISRKREEDALRESRQRLISIYDTVGDVVFLLAVEPDGGFRFESVNQRFAAATGVPAEAVVGRRVEDVIPAASLALVLGRYREAIASGTVVRWEETSVYPAGRLTAEVSVAPIVNEAGLCTHLVGAVHDVTARKLAEERHAQAELLLRQSQKLESVGRLAGGVAHDFNNILGVILGYGELMRGQLGEGHPARPRLEQIVSAAQRAAGLTRQLLAFSRKQVLQPRTLDLAAVVHDMIGMLERVVGEDIQFQVVGGQGLGSVLADPTQIEQVIMNLVVNARDAMPRGGELTLETANVEFDETYAAEHPPAMPGRFVMLAVSDTGVGMDEETQRQIFEPFFTTKPVGEGTGLGLATVYGIVKQTGGYIWVYSEVGHGTSFKVYLPRTDDPAEARAPDAGPRSFRGTETILVVEDSEALRELVSELLGDRGYNVLAVANGEEALDLVKKRRGAVDLVVADVIMPRMGGAELVGRLREDFPGIAAVFMSGYTSGAISRQGHLEPGAVFLEKPFTGDQLGETVRRTLDRHSRA